MDLLVLMAVLPAAWLLRYVYRLDPVEKEPPRLLASLLILGGVSCIPAVVLESIGIDVIMGGAQPTTYAALAFENFIVIALSEELCKMIFLRLKTRKSAHFNYVFDGIVYAVFVSLGFAILENIGYVLQFGMATALVRAVTAIPGHAIFGVFMGCFYGLEKRAEIQGQPGLRTIFAICSLVVPVLCHGFYDFCASINNEVFLVIFFAFLIILVVVASRLVKWMAQQAHPISSQEYGAQQNMPYTSPQSMPYATSQRMPYGTPQDTSYTAHSDSYGQQAPPPPPPGSRQYR